MTLDEIREKIKGCAEEMNSRYGGVVFDEWVVVSLERNRARILHYAGPRNDEFLKNFVTDLGALRTALLDGKYGAGDFEFARHGIGTSHEAFLVLGPGLYLICNNTRESMDHRQKHPLARRPDSVRESGGSRLRESAGNFLGHENLHQALTWPADFRRAHESGFKNSCKKNGRGN